MPKYLVIKTSVRHHTVEADSLEAAEEKVRTNDNEGTVVSSKATYDVRLIHQQPAASLTISKT